MIHRHASAFLPTAAFVLLWSSGAIVSEIGLRHGSPLALLLCRYAIAFVALATIAIRKGAILPARDTLWRNALTGLLISGFYTVFYLLALDNGVTPGALATLLGIQPILTLFLTERRVTATRLIGLICALAGLALVVADGLVAMRFAVAGFACAGVALVGITAGSILQKRETQAPWVVLPLQYAIGLAVVGVAASFGEVRGSWEPGFVLSALWLALAISIGATFLLYRLIARGNLVNVTSLFYLVPGVTAAMDWAILGHPVSAPMLGGLALVVAGLVIVFRSAKT